MEMARYRRVKYTLECKDETVLTFVKTLLQTYGTNDKENKNYYEILNEDLSAFFLTVTSTENIFTIIFKKRLNIIKITIHETN